MNRKEGSISSSSSSGSSVLWSNLYFLSQDEDLASIIENGRKLMEIEENQPKNPIKYNLRSLNQNDEPKLMYETKSFTNTTAPNLLNKKSQRNKLPIIHIRKIVNVELVDDVLKARIIDHYDDEIMLNVSELRKSHTNMLLDFFINAHLKAIDPKIEYTSITLNDDDDD